jgi:hypothetical protein
MSRALLWFRWCLLTAFGLAAGWFLGQAAGIYISKSGAIPLAVLASTGICGFGVGAAQWLEVRRLRYWPAARKWVIASTVGMTLGLSVGLLIAGAIMGVPAHSGPLRRALGSAAAGFAGGLGVGMMQRLSYHMILSNVRWGMTNAVGLAAGCLLGSIFADGLAGSFNTRGGLVMLILFAGLGMGSFSGLALVEQSRQQQAVEDTFL